MGESVVPSCITMQRKRVALAKVTTTHIVNIASISIAISAIERAVWTNRIWSLRTLGPLTVHLRESSCWTSWQSTSRHVQMSQMRVWREGLVNLDEASYCWPVQAVRTVRPMQCFYGPKCVSTVRGIYCEIFVARWNRAMKLCNKNRPCTSGLRQQFRMFISSGTLV